MHLKKDKNNIERHLHKKYVEMYVKKSKKNIEGYIMKEKSNREMYLKKDINNIERCLKKNDLMGNQYTKDKMVNQFFYLDETIWLKRLRS